MRRLRVLVFAFALGGCSFLTKFDIDGQPCDKSEPNPALSCLSDAGYFCVEGFCKKVAGPSNDAGMTDAGDAGKDSGVADGGRDGGSDAGSMNADAGDGGDGG